MTKAMEASEMTMPANHLTDTETSSGGELTTRVEALTAKGASAFADNWFK